MTKQDNGTGDAGLITSGAVKEAADRGEGADDDLTLFNKKLMSLVFHKLRSPLSSTIGLLNLLLGKKDPLTQWQETILGALQRSAMQQMDFIEELVEISRIQRGVLEIAIAPVPISKIARQRLDGIMGLARQKEIAIEEEIDDGVWILTDENKAVSILNNILHNAVKFSHRGGKVTLKAAAEGEKGIIEISDAGVGIEPDKIGKLFDFSLTCGALGTEGEKGSGFGLPICQNLSGMIGCGISMESKPGEGTKVTLSFKRADQA